MSPSAIVERKQVANILLPRAYLVPTGEDQLPHVELAREACGT